MGDDHNVDTIDGLILPMVSALAVLASSASQGEISVQQAVDAALRTLAVTRRSTELRQYVEVAVPFLAAALQGKPLVSVAQDVFSQSYGGDLAQAVRERGDLDPVVPCYVGGAFPALLHFTYKYASSDVGVALLASANAGGENVHRGAILGLLLGTIGVQKLPHRLSEGLYNHDELRHEIHAFVEVVLKDGSAQQGSLEV